MKTLREKIASVQDPYIDTQVYGPTSPDNLFMGVLTFYKGQDAQFTVTFTDESYGAVAGRLGVMLGDLLEDLEHKKQRLPSDERETIRYW
jgi:hypothetical protein